jgi:hypothetical protein
MSDHPQVNRYERQTMMIWDYAITLQIQIERPPETVWPWFFGDKKAIWTRSEYETVSGEEGRPGAVFMHQYAVLDTRYYYYYEAIRLLEQRELVLKITCRKSESDTSGALIGYDVIRLEPRADHSMVTLQQFVAFPTDLERSDLAGESEKHDRFLAGILEDLKRLVEHGK